MEPLLRGSKEAFYFSIAFVWAQRSSSISITVQIVYFEHNMADAYFEMLFDWGLVLITYPSVLNFSFFNSEGVPSVPEVGVKVQGKIVYMVDDRRIWRTDFISVHVIHFDKGLEIFFIKLFIST